jgi:hypothetical protein
VYVHLGHSRAALKGAMTFIDTNQRRAGKREKVGYFHVCRWKNIRLLKLQTWLENISLWKCLDKTIAKLFSIVAKTGKLQLPFYKFF